MAFGIDDAIAEGLKLINKWIPDPALRAQAATEYQASMERLRLAQLALNTAEVQSGSLLGKWRGALGWALVGSFVYQFIVFSFLTFIVLLFDPAFPVEKLPKLEWKEFGGMLLGMLGLGG